MTNHSAPDKLTIEDVGKAISAMNISQMKDSILTKSLVAIHQQLLDAMRENERLRDELRDLCFAFGKADGNATIQHWSDHQKNAYSRAMNLLGHPSKHTEPAAVDVAGLTWVSKDEPPKTMDNE